MIKIGNAGNKNISLDLNKLIDTRMLVAANSGGGKSWFFRLLAERCAGKVQIIILDPEGEFVTLREKIDIALIGEDGEWPAEIKTAKLLARKLAEQQASAIIDLYGLRTNDRREYVNQFLESLMSLGRKYWHPILVFIDEAHMFAPETGKSASTDAVIALMSQGRKRGYAGILSTQRLSKIHKDAIAETNNVLIGRTWQDLDQRRAGDLLGMRKPDRTKLRAPYMKAGEFFGFGPALTTEGVCKFKTDKVASTHPKPGERHKMDVPPASAAILKVVAQMGDLPAQVQEEEDYIARLQGENIALQREVAQLKRDKPKPEQIIKQTTIEVPFMPKNNFGRIAETLQSHLDAVYDVPNKIADEIARIEAQIQETKPKQQPVKASKPKQFTPITTLTSGKSSGNSSDDLPIGERKVLTACAQYPEGLERKQISILTDYKQSSRNAYINRLQKRGAVEIRGRKLFATDLGYELLGPGFQPLPTGQELLDYWMRTLPQGEKVILEVLVNHYPQEIDRDYLSNETDYKQSSRNAYLNRLKARELITIPSLGMVKASDNLMVELA